jgi:hypothetical protein
MGLLKNFVAGVPVVGPSAQLLYRSLSSRRGQTSRRDQSFQGSASYWDARYRSGGNSGAGSYHHLAEFKAEILNRFVHEHSITDVIEFGCGDGAQLRPAEYPNYIGVDISPAAVALCRRIFEQDTSKFFYLAAELLPGTTAQLSLSLDVIYHLVEDAVFFGYMSDLFAASTKYVAIYASNENKSWPESHVRHRRFTDWVAVNQPQWVLLEHVPNRYPYDPEDPDLTSFAEFFIYRLTDASGRTPGTHLR